MECTKALKLTTLILVSCMLFSTPPTYANPATPSTVSIEEGSPDWGDIAARAKLLSTVPKWSPEVIKAMFDEYKHPERHNLPIFINGTPVNYNALFINAYWGPTINPFVKFPRPAKVFIFIKNTDGTKKYFMAPIIQDQNDKNYYVYDKSELTPIPIKLWVYNKTDGYPCGVHFNVCTGGYGVLPQDTCEGKNFESEIYQEPQEFLGKSSLSTKHASYPSPARDITQDWREKEKSMRPKTQKLVGASLDGGVPWNDPVKRQALLQTVTTWPNYATIKANYAKIRDLRYFQDEAVPGFMRRLSWLYPDDGCWSRTAGIMKDMFGPMNNTIVNTFPRPSKVFAFGNLCVNTPNTPAGKLSWWYHLAAIVRDAETNQTYALDPSIDPTAPLPIEKWMALITANTGKCAPNTNAVNTFNICNGYGTTPFDRCELTSNLDFENEIRAELMDKYFRKFERERQIELGRDPNSVLGDTPPW